MQYAIIDQYPCHFCGARMAWAALNSHTEDCRSNKRLGSATDQAAAMQRMVEAAARYQASKSA